MKKELSILLVLAMILSFSACKSTDKSVVDDTGQNTSVSDNDKSEGNTEDTFVEVEPDGSEANDTPPAAGSVVNTGNESDNNGTQNGNPEHSHVYKKAVTVATCEDDGFTTYTCECGSKYTDNTVLAKGHQYSDWKEIKAATEKNVGKESRKCKNCNKSEEREIPKLIKGHTHKYNPSITMTATCESEGIKTYACSCGASYTETIGKKPHNYSKTVVKPTCTTPGYTKNTCECGKTYYDGNVKATGHNYQGTTTAATCTSEGYTTYKCSACGDAYTGNKVSALKHKYEDSVVAPTCTNSGYTTHTCSACGYYYADKKTQATGHKDIKTETIAAGCITDGAKYEVCGVCGVTVKSTIIPLTNEHHYVTKTCSEAYKEVTQNNKTLLVDNVASYQHKTDWLCKICSSCHAIKQDGEGDIWSKYSDEEQCKIMLGYVNELRKQYKAEHPGYYNIIYDKVELVYDAKLTELANIRAKEISTSYSHDTGTRTGADENINSGGDTLQQVFDGWKNSPGHYDIMITNTQAKFGFGRYIDENGIVFNTMLFWEEGWSAELWELEFG